MLNALVETGTLQLGQEVIVPAVGWSTSLFTVAPPPPQRVCGQCWWMLAKTHCVWKVIGTDLFWLYICLGCPSRATGPVIIEDACGAHGAKIGEKMCGSIGAAGAFSFFFSHHLSTVEGGMINTDSLAVADAARSIRAHGWIRERSDAEQWKAAHPEIDPRFLFVSAGYNLRPTEMTGAMGIRQVPVCRVLWKNGEKIIVDGVRRLMDSLAFCAYFRNSVERFMRALLFRCCSSPPPTTTVRKSAPSWKRVGSQQDPSPDRIWRASLRLNGCPLPRYKENPSGGRSP